MFIGVIEDIPNLEYINCCTLCAEPFFDPLRMTRFAKRSSTPGNRFQLSRKERQKDQKLRVSFSLLFPLCSNGLIKYKKITDSRHRSQSNHASYHPVQSAR